MRFTIDVDQLESGKWRSTVGEWTGTIKSSSGFETCEEAFKDAARFIQVNLAILVRHEAEKPEVRWFPTRPV